MATDTVTRNQLYVVPWKKCAVCQQSSAVFKSPRDFCQHLRELHCTKEGGSFVCRYGVNGVCPSLPLEGVSDRDYEDHVAKDHVASDTAGQSPTGSQSSPSKSSPQITANNEPSVVQDQHRWNMFMSKVNLPAALNDPRLSRRETDFFTKTWGESFDDQDVLPSPFLPEITKDDFRKYVKRISKRLKEHAKSTSTLSEINSVSQNKEKSTLPEDHFPALQCRKLEKLRPDYDTIPKIFMHPGFSLENRDTFNAVFPWTQIDGGQTENSGRQSSKLLQEKFSHYLDVVEVQICRQISLRSDAFFEAMASHDELQENMTQTCAAIKKLRDRIHCLDQALAQGPLRIIRCARSRNNLSTLYNKLKLMATVHQTQPTIQLLLSTSEFVGALDLISTTQEVLTQELAGVHSFRHLGSQLAEMRHLIENMMQEDFVRYAATDLNRPLSEGETLLEENSDSVLVLTDIQDKLVSIVLGMLRQHKYSFIDVYREEAMTCIKAILKQTVIEAISVADNVDSEAGPGSLADQMRLLNYQQWMNLLDRVFFNLSIILQRVKNVCSVIEEVVLAASGPGRPESGDNSPASGARRPSDVASAEGAEKPEPTEAASQSEPDGSQSDSAPLSDSEKPEASNSTLPRLGLSLGEIDTLLSVTDRHKVLASLIELMCQVCDHAHDRCVKLLVARAKDGFLEKLSSSEFVQLSRLVESFVGQSERLCGRRSTSLRASLQSQASRFVNRFHEERKTKLSLILDNERWKQADVPSEFQALVSHMSASRDLSLPVRQHNDTSHSTQEYLFVDTERFAVVGTVLLLVKMVVEYCQCVNDIPAASPDLLTRLVELLKMFNSRTCQLILGAGAVQLVGLRTISTKNLALASRCLQLVAHYLPLVRTHFSTKLPDKQRNMLKHFDSILKDYNDHIAELSNKLVYIMDTMLESSLAKWEVKPPMPSAAFRNISKQMVKFHEGICDLLPPAQVGSLLGRVHQNFKLFLRTQLIKLGVTKDGGPQQGLVVADVTFYLGNIQNLQGLEKLNSNMDDIWDKR